MANLYYLNGDIIPLSGGGGGSSASPSTDFNRVVKGIAHRGYSTTAPENTIPAFQLAKQEGFFYVETDVQFTSDGVPVLLHDASIDRTSNGTGNIADLTFEQVRQYDFGSWKSATYTGTQIPSFEEFMRLCRDLVLHPYIEIKCAMTTTQVKALLDIIEAAGMKGKVTWISYNYTCLGYVTYYDPTARIGVLIATLDSTTAQIALTAAAGLSTGSNEVFIDTSSTSDAAAEICLEAGYPIETWGTLTNTVIINAHPYYTGFTHGSINAEEVLHDASIGSNS